MHVTRITRQKRNENRYSIYVDGTYSFSISDENLARLGIAEGDELTAAELDEIAGEEEKYRAMDSALRLLALRSRSVRELEGRLKLKRFSASAIDHVLQRLHRLGYLNDLQFARDWTAHLVQKGKGLGLIRAELKRKGIGAEIIADVLSDYQELSEKEIERVKAVALQKVRQLRHLTPPVIARRLYGFLARRGFSTEVIEEVMKAVRKEVKEENEKNIER